MMRLADRVVDKVDAALESVMIIPTGTERITSAKGGRVLQGYVCRKCNEFPMTSQDWVKSF